MLLSVVVYILLLWCVGQPRAVSAQHQNIGRGCNFGQETISLTFGYEHTPENLPVVVYSIIVAIDMTGQGRFAPLPKLGQAKTNTRLATTH